MKRGWSPKRDKLNAKMCPFCKVYMKPENFIRHFETDACGVIRTKDWKAILKAWEDK